MEQMLTNLREALEEIKKTKQENPAQKILQKAIDQAVSIKNNWKTNSSTQI